MSKKKGSGLLISVRTTALDRARALLGVSKGEFESDLDAHRTVTRPVLNLERPGLGSEQLKKQKEKKPLLPTEERLMRSINNKRLKRKKDMREMKHAATLEDSSDDENELVSKASSFSKKAKRH